MNYLKVILMMLAVLLLPKGLRAEHIIGGEMYYECIGPGQYIFTMKLFRDCNSSGANFDNPATFGVFSETGSLIQSVTASVDNVIFVDTDLDSPCLAIPPNICVQQGTYIFTVSGLSSNIEYNVVYQRCCRNQTIQNLTNPGMQGLTIQAQIPPFADVGCNSSPSFNNFPPPVLCNMESLVFDHSATDSDGDSLSYTLCSPYIGGSQAMPMPVPPSSPPYDQVLWANGFNSVAPLNANPGLSINPQTGLLTGTPQQLGQFVVGVCVEEWRNGQLLSINTRDFQFNVAFCEPLSEALIAVPELPDLCQDLEVTFFNLSNPSNTFHWDFGDPESELDFSTDYHGTYVYPDTGMYTITLITNPGFFCSDTTTLSIFLGYEAQIAIQLTGFECVNGVQQYSFQAIGEFEPDVSTITWDFGANASQQSATGEFASGISFDSPGTFLVQISILNDACTGIGQLTLNVAPPPEISITPQNTFCTGLSHNFSQTSVNANQYLWNFGVLGDDGAQSTLANPNFVFPEQGEYTVSLTAQGAGNCPVTVSEVFDMQPLLAPDVPGIPVLCLDASLADFTAAGSFQQGASFTWSFENAVPATSTSQNPQEILFLESGVHQVMLSISENGCTRSDSVNVTVHENPIAGFDAFPKSGCAPLTVVFQNTSFTESTTTAYTWNFGDGNTETVRSRAYIYENPGIYSVSLLMENLNGCIDTDFILRDTIIEVLPSPKAGFSISPERISVVDPVLTLEDLSIGNTGCTYFFDGQQFDDCNFTYALQNVEPQPIWLTVVNDEGCRSTAEGMIYVSDHLIYVPNSFTPNNDGLNDIFTPVTTAVATFEMYITDRWGREVYSSSDVERGWDGSVQNGSYFSEAGVYQYQIVVTDYLGWNFEYLGYVTLLR